jgi:hypothetical protein
VPAATAARELSAIAAHAGWTLYRGAGDSMLPHYGENSLMLVAPATVAGLRPGMLAVYRDAAGDLVGHMVTAASTVAANTRGVNAGRTDPEAIVADNLVGVIVGIFHTRADGTAAELPVVIGKRF